MHSLVIASNEETNKAKGINKNAVRNIRHKEYIDVLFNKNVIRHKMKRIHSKLDKIGTLKIVKFLYLVLIIKGIFLMMVLVVWVFFIKM